MKVGIVGGSGYLGAELLRLLEGHPVFDVAVVQADSSAGGAVAALYPNLAPAYSGLSYGELDVDGLDGLDLVFVALPAGRSHELVAGAVDRTGLVVDLGPDFRLRDASAYPRWYGFEHGAPGLLARAAYGLPEVDRDPIVGASLIAAPGCYVTAAAVALTPLVRAGVADGSPPIIIDAASGTSGAGRTPARATHHPQVTESFSAYGLLDHRHTPEMEQVIGAPVLFTPHLAPMSRGILATCYARPLSREAGLDAHRVLVERYRDEPFVTVTEEAPSTGETYGSNSVRVSSHFDERTGYLVLIAALDNLVKGGAGQAVQAANCALGLEETWGLTRVGMSP